MIAPEADPEDPGRLGPGGPLAGPLAAGALTVAGGGALLVTGLPGGGGALVVTGLPGGGGALGGGGARVVAGLLLGGPALVVAGLLVVRPAPAVDGGALDGGGWELGGGLDGGGGAEDEPGPLLDPDDGGDGADGWGLSDPDEPDGGGTWGVLGPTDVLPDELPPAVLSVTYCPNRSSVPAGGSEAVTRASSAGSASPAYPTASPLAASSRLARPKAVPVRSGTARRRPASKVSSRAPVVPTGRSRPRSGSPTSTRASRSIFLGAGRTATTEERVNPFHFRLQFSNVTDMRFVSCVKGRSGFPHEHFTAGAPC